jgi:hypothetical protein
MTEVDVAERRKNCGVKETEPQILKLITREKILDIGELRVSKTTLHGRKPGYRFLIYLPHNRTYLWEALHNLNTKVRVFIQVPQESLEGETER